MPPILDEINRIVVKGGICDFFVVETDVHYLHPTDTNLLFDARRKMIGLIAIVCSEIGITASRVKMRINLI